MNNGPTMRTLSVYLVANAEINAKITPIRAPPKATAKKDQLNLKICSAFRLEAPINVTRLKIWNNT